jgi:alpha-L-fucosidase
MWEVLSTSCPDYYLNRGGMPLTGSANTPLDRLGRIFACLLLAAAVFAEEPKPRNLPEREEWFSDLAIGMFISWSVDSQLGSVISHSLVGSSKDYADRFFAELPQTFEPKRFDPTDWARLARVAGMRYVMFTAKHHSGFCMFDTETTDFSIVHTPFRRDATRAIVDAFRAEGNRNRPLLLTGRFLDPAQTGT